MFRPQKRPVLPFRSVPFREVQGTSFSVRLILLTQICAWFGPIFRTYSPCSCSWRKLWSFDFSWFETVALHWPRPGNSFGSEMCCLCVPLPNVSPARQRLRFTGVRGPWPPPSMRMPGLLGSTVPYVHLPVEPKVSLLTQEQGIAFCWGLWETATHLGQRPNTSQRCPGT